MSQSRRELKPPKALTVTISPELRAQLDALAPAGHRNTCPLDAEKQAALLEFYGKVNQRELAKVLGICHTTMLRWYRILSAGKDKP